MNIREIFLSIFFRGFICLILMLITDITFAQSIEVLKQKEIQRPQRLREKFGFGVEYLMPAPKNLNRIIGQYSELGATWSKFNGPDTTWNDIEPKPPIGGRHIYSWKKVDDMVLTAQRAGFKNLIVVLKSNSKWGTKRRKSSGLLESFSAWRGMVSTPPKDEENFKYYQDYVFNFVERYDGDGKDDMPGLLYPVLDYEIETEAQHQTYWLGTADEYITVLKTAYAGVKKANPRARVILSGFAFWDIFDEGPKTGEEIDSSLNAMPLRYPEKDIRHGFGEKFRGHLDFNAQILQAKDYFDLVEFHLLSYYTSIPGTVKWIREEMRKNGYEKPVWMGDAGAVILPCTDKKGFWSPWSTWTLFSGAPYKNGDELFEVLASKKDRYALTYRKVKEWFEAEQANILVKSAVMAMAEGVEGMNWWTWKDERALLKANGPGKSWALCGLIENDNQTKRPAFYAYKLLIHKLGGFSLVEKLNIRPDIRAYKFTVRDRFVYVIWLESGNPSSPSKAGEGVLFEISSIVGNQNVKVTPEGPYLEEMPPANTILLTEKPIFIDG